MNQKEWDFSEVPDEELIACCYWEYARESAFIRTLRQRSLESWRSTAPRDEALHQDLQRLQSIGEAAEIFLRGWGHEPGAIYQCHDDTAPNYRHREAPPITGLREVRKDVEAEGLLTEAAVQKLAGHFGGKPNSLVDKVEAFLKLEADPERLEAAVRERQKAETLAFLDRKIGGFGCWQDRCIDEEEYENEARLAAAVLPSGEVLDKILRYETKLERQMYRAMAQLERVRRMRRGEAIPAPLSVEVSDRG
jgi:hypothetical protein